MKNKRGRHRLARRKKALGGMILGLGLAFAASAGAAGQSLWWKSPDLSLGRKARSQALRTETSRGKFHRAVELKAGYFRPINASFRDIYGSGLDAEGIFLFDVLEKTSLWAGAGFFRKGGELSFTREKTTLRLLSLNAGLQFRFTDGGIKPYLGAGLGVVFFSESVPSETVGQTRMSYFVQAGASLRWSRRIGIDVEGRYTLCRLIDASVDVGGLRVLGGVKYVF